MIDSWRDNLYIYGNFIKDEVCQNKIHFVPNEIVLGSISSASFYLIQNILQSLYGSVGITVSLPFIARTFLGASSTAASLYSGNLISSEMIKINNNINQVNNNGGNNKQYNKLVSYDLTRRCIIGTALYLLLEHGFYKTAFPSNSSDYGVFVNTFRRKVSTYSIPVFKVDASSLQRKRIQMLGKSLGCHQCGSKAGKFIADHMPPTKIAIAQSSSFWNKLRSIKVNAILYVVVLSIQH